MRSEAEEEEVPEEPDSWVPEAPVLSRREQMEQSLLTGRRRFRVTNLLSEREDGADTHLEMLHAERDANDRDAADQSEDQVGESDLPPTQQNP